MGSAYSCTNLGRDCSSFKIVPNGTRVRWGDSFELFMGKDHRKLENDNRQETWSVQYTYKTGFAYNLCCLQLKAISSGEDNSGVKSIRFSVEGSLVGRTHITLKIAGGITRTISPSSNAPVSFTRYEHSCLIETTIVSYGFEETNSYVVLEMKQTPGSESADVATLAYYFVAEDEGLSMVAKICGNKKGNGFGVEVEGLFKHPAADVRHVIHTTKSTGVWSPTACSHYNEAKGRNGNETGIPRNASVMTQSNNQKEQDIALVGQVVKHAVFSKHNEDLLNSGAGVQSNHQGEDAVGDQVVKRDATFSSSVREQCNKGLINSSGYTTGYLNNTIIFMKCRFLNL